MINKYYLARQVYISSALIQEFTPAFCHIFKSTDKCKTHLHISHGMPPQASLVSINRHFRDPYPICFNAPDVHYFTMDKKDLAFFGAAILIVIIVALIGKPLMMGEPIPFLSPSEPFVDPDEPLSIPSDLPTLTPRPAETPLPPPTPTWDGIVKTVEYVDPSTYHIENPEKLAIGDQPTQYQQNRTMTTYAVIHGDASGVTEIVTIPSGYWEMHITFDPWTESPTNSFLNFQIRNAEDRSDYQVFNSVNEGPRPTKESTDKKMWVIERYDSGSFYFVIDQQLLKSYTIQIMIPKTNV